MPERSRKIQAIQGRREWIAPNGDRIVRNEGFRGYRCFNASGYWLFDSEDISDCIWKYVRLHGKACQTHISRADRTGRHQDASIQAGTV